MPRKVRNPGSGKAPVNTPASGIPAMGQLWAGQSAGEHPREDRPSRPQPSALERLAMCAVGPDGKLLPTERTARNRALAEEALGNLLAVMRDPEHQGLQISAANAVLDRVEGKPKQVTELGGIDGKPLFPSLSVNIARGTNGDAG